MENKIPTAEEFLKVYLTVDDNFISSMKEQMSKLKGFNFDNIPDFMTEFAKLHVTEALKAKVNAMKKESQEDSSYSIGELHAFTENAYPLTNIK